MSYGYNVTEEDVKYITENHERMSYTDIAWELGLNKWTVKNIVNEIRQLIKENKPIEIKIMYPNKRFERDE